MPNPRFASRWIAVVTSRSRRASSFGSWPGDFLHAGRHNESDAGEWPMSRPSRRIFTDQGCAVATSSDSAACSPAPSSSARVLGLLVDDAADTSPVFTMVGVFARHGRRRPRLLGPRPSRRRVGGADDRAATSRPPARPTPRQPPRRKASVLPCCATSARSSWSPLALAIAAFWVAGQFGEWRLATAIAVGVGLGLANHLVTEFWLLKIIANGEQPSRATMMRSTLVRLLVLTLVAVRVAVVWWPDGIGLLLGLAVFRLIALVMTTVPL